MTEGGSWMPDAEGQGRRERHAETFDGAVAR
jgi:hypothetical protein